MKARRTKRGSGFDLRIDTEAAASGASLSSPSSILPDVEITMQETKMLIGNYEIGKVLGRGNFAEVREAKHIPTGENGAFPQRFGGLHTGTGPQLGACGAKPGQYGRAVVTGS